MRSASAASGLKPFPVGVGAWYSSVPTFVKQLRRLEKECVIGVPQGRVQNHSTIPIDTNGIASGDTRRHGYSVCRYYCR